MNLENKGNRIYEQNKFHCEIFSRNFFEISR